MNDEHKLNSLKSIFQVNKRHLDDVLIALEEIRDNYGGDRLLSNAVNDAISKQNAAIKAISIECGYK